MKHIFTFFMLFTLTFSVSQTAIDTTLQQPKDTAAVETTNDRNTFGDLVKGEPGKAAFLSLVIPGGGQIYNKKWWKVPLAIGLDAITLYNVIDSRNDYKGYEERYLDALNNGGSDFDINYYKLYRNAARKRYDYNRVYFVIGHFVTVLDAFIDRHLMDFDISDDLSVSPTIIDNRYNMGMNLSYALNGKKMKKVTP